MNVLHIRQHREEPGFWQEIGRENPFSLLNFIGNTPLIEIHEMTRRLKGAQIFAKAAELLVGPSSGAALWASLRLAESTESGVVVTILPDGGDRYFSRACMAYARYL